MRQRDERQRQVVQLEREAVVTQDEREKLNDDLAGVQAEQIHYRYTDTLQIHTDT